MPDYYEEFKPGQVISAERMNGMQEQIRADILSEAAKAAGEIDSVKEAANAEKLDGKTGGQLITEIVDLVLARLHAERGYRTMFKRLKVGEEKVIRHALGDFPLVDIYQLDYFPVVAQEDNGNMLRVWAGFFIYHSSEKRLLSRRGMDQLTIDIESDDHPQFRIPFTTMLERYKVPVADDTPLSDVETEFWNLFNSEPNDAFDDNQCFHSPWFERHCLEGKTWKEMRSHWNNLFFQMRPRRTLNYPGVVAKACLEIDADFVKWLFGLNCDEKPDEPAPTQVEIRQYDHDTLGLTLLTPPILPEELFDPQHPAGDITEQPIEDADKEIVAMVLLKT